MSVALKKVSIIPFAFYLFFSLSLLSTPSHAADESGTPIASVTRMLGFEPHPSTIEIPGRFMLQGKQISAEIEIIETWNTDREVPVIEKLGFRLRLFSDGNEAAVVEIPVQQIDAKKIKKGGILATGMGNSVGMSVIVQDIQKKGKNVSGLTLEFAVRSTGDELKTTETPSTLPSDTASPSSDTLAPASSMNFGKAVQMAKLLADRADAMTASAVSEKAMLYRKALSALPVDADSTEIAALRAEITAKLEALQPPTGQAPVTTVPAEPSGAVAAPSLSSSTAQDSHMPSPEVRSLFEQAQKAFDRDEEPAARDFLRQATEKDPAYFEAWLLLGKNAVGNSKYARAKEALDKALSLRADDPEAGALYFKACYYLGEGELGIEKLFGMVGRRPDAFAPRMALADAYYQSGDLPMCEEQCLVLLDKFPGNDRPRDLLAKTRERMK